MENGPSPFMSLWHVTESDTTQLISHWRIWGWGVPDAHHSLWDPILSFSHTFSPKSTHVGSPRPPPLQEILDPPLYHIAESDSLDVMTRIEQSLSLTLIEIDHL